MSSRLSSEIVRAVENYPGFTLHPGDIDIPKDNVLYLESGHYVLEDTLVFDRDDLEHLVISASNTIITPSPNVNWEDKPLVIARNRVTLIDLEIVSFVESVPFSGITLDNMPLGRDSKSSLLGCSVSGDFSESSLDIRAESNLDIVGGMYENGSGSSISLNGGEIKLSFTSLTSIGPSIEGFVRTMILERCKIHNPILAGIILDEPAEYFEMLRSRYVTASSDIFADILNTRDYLIEDNEFIIVSKEDIDFKILEDSTPSNNSIRFQEDGFYEVVYAQDEPEWI